MATDPRIRYDILANAEGEEDVRRLANELGKLDEAIDPAVADTARRLSGELQALGAQSSAMQAYQRALVDANEAGRRLEESSAALAKLKGALEGVETPTRAQTGQLNKLGDAARKAQEDYTRKTEVLANSRGTMESLGVSTGNLAESEKRLGAAAATTRQEIAKIGQQGQAVQQFTALAQATDKARERFQAADAAVEAYRRSLDANETPTRQQTQTLGRLSEAARQAQVAYQSSAQAQAAAGTALRAAGVDTERLATTQARLPPTLNATAGAARQVAAGYQQAGTAAQASARQQTGSNEQVKQGLDGIAGKLNSLRDIGVGAILGSQTAQMLRSVTETADAFNNLRARIRLVTGEGPALQQALADVEAISLRTGQSLEATGTLFTRVLTAGREMGLVQADALALTESINQAVAISGASAQASDAAITQLIQGLQSGVLRGEEFNSVVEQAPRLAQALADGMGVARSALRGLAQDGKISAQTVIEALQSQRGALEREFGTLPATVGRALENLNTRWTTFVGSLDAGTGASSAVAAAINGIAENLDEVAGMAQRAGAVLLAAVAIQGAGALRTLATQALATGGAMALLRTEIEKVPKVVNIAVAVTGFEIGFQIGDMLRENSSLARKLGVNITEYFVQLVNELRFVKEAAAAIFTDDTIDAAFDRYTKRAEEQRAIFRQLYEEAEQSPEVVRAAAAVAAQALEDTGTKATADAASAQIAASAGIKLPAVAKTAKQQADAMADVAAKSKDAAAALGDALPAALAKLSGNELGRFRQTLVGALGEGAEKAGLLQTVLLETGRRAAQALGVDVAQATKTLSREFVEAQDNLAQLVRSVDAFRAAGLDAGKVLEEALRKMAEGAKSQQEFDALRVRIENLGKAGLLSKQQVADLLDTARKKAEEANKEVDKLAEAFKTLGLTSQAELRKVAEANKAAWQTIRDDATTSLATKREAFRKYAESALAANVSVHDSTLRSQAQAYGLEIAFDKAGKAIVRAVGEGAAQTDNLADRTRNATREAVNLGTAWDEAQRKWRAGFDSFGGGAKYDAQGFALNTSGNRVVAGNQLKIPEGYYFDAEAANKDPRFRAGQTDGSEFIRPSPELQAKMNLDPVSQRGEWLKFVTDPASPNFDPVLAAREARRSADQTRADTANAAAGTSGLSAVQATQVAAGRAAGGTTINVVIGGQSRAITVGDSATADAIVKALEEAYKAGGGG